MAGGKGVFLCKDKEALKKAALQVFEENIFKCSSSPMALIEEYQEGWELSITLLTNGKDYQLFPFSQDHKGLYANNKGPNTGGMGAYAPIQLPENLRKDIEKKVVQACIHHIQKQSIFYRGILYIGIMVTPKGPKVLEFNVRLGDPEAQVLLPLLEGDWTNLFYTLAKDGQLLPCKWKEGQHACCVVLASEGYPLEVQKGTEILGNLNSEEEKQYFLHAGSLYQKQKERWEVQGGRVLSAIGIGSSQEVARSKAYAQSKKVSWKGMQFREDIAAK